jgi:amino acid permease
VAQFLVFLNTLGLAIGALVVGGDTTPRALNFFVSYYKIQVPANWDALLLSRVLWVTFCTAVTAPLAFARDISKLGWTGAVSAVAIAYLVIVVRSVRASPAR